MKVALVIENFRVNRGGAERSTCELGCCLSELGLQVTLVAAKVDLAGSDTLPFAVREVPVGGLTRRGRWKTFQKVVSHHLRQENYDIVHSIVPIAEADVFQPRGGSILYSTKRHAAAYSNGITRGWKHFTAGLNGPRRARIAGERTWCAQRNDSILAAVSEYVKQQFQSEYGLAEKRIRLIRNGVAVERVREKTVINEGQKLRRLYDPHNQKRLFLFAAENFRLKGLEWLIRSAAEAVKQREKNQRDLQIFVAGSDQYKHYWRLGAKLNLEGKLLFMGPTTQMGTLLQMCDVVVLPTYNDACSRLIIEGLAAAKPGITTRYNGAADFLQSGKYGAILENCNDVSSLARALLAMCDETQYQQIRRNIEKDNLGDVISMRRHARELVRLYQEIVNRR